MNWLQAALVEEVRVGLARKGWSQAVLARRVGITEKHLSQLMTGRVQGTLSGWSRVLACVRTRSVLTIPLDPES